MMIETSHGNPPTADAASIDAAQPATPPTVPPSRYDNHSREQLVRLLERRDAERQLGLVWERDEIEADRALNDDFVALELDPALSHGDAPWDNLIIEGDNHDALRYLRMTHAGRIRCIYIDPPYNTGNRDFVYNDRFIDKSHRFRHSLWLEFMYRRLTLARDLLAEDGVIFVSIDDNELFRLGMLMDRVFGAKNKLSCFVWQTDGNFDNQAKVKVNHEYVLAYCRRIELFPMPAVVDPNISADSKLFRAQVRNTIVKNGPKNPVTELALPAGFPASFERGTIKARDDKWPHILSDAIVEDGKLQNAVSFRSGWANRDLCEAFIDANFSPIPDTKGQPTSFALTANGAIENVKDREKPSHVLSILRGLGGTQADGSWLERLGIDFTYPKPVSMIKYLLSIAGDKHATYLDFFGGSGTTAHAVANLNAEDGGNRKFILVSNTEATDDQPDKNLCRDVCAERVRRIMAGYTNAKGDAVAGLGGGFAYLRATRIARHRLARRLGHAEIWHALQLIHALPLQPQAGNGLMRRKNDALALAYLPEWHASEVTALGDWCTARPQAQVIVYSWTPERLHALPPGVDTRPIPESLRIRFGGVRA